MDLWIRSQDNGLFNPKIIKPPLEDGSVWCYIENTNILLGQYKTKERALEVLDEIQDILKPKTLITDTGKPIECSDGGYVYMNQKTKLEYQQLGTHVYEMPQE